MHYYSSITFFSTTFSPVNRVYFILNSTYTYQLRTLTETVLRLWFTVRRSDKKQNMVLKKKKKNFSYAVKVHLAHCAHGKTPNELQSVPEIKNQQLLRKWAGKKETKLQAISEGW